MVLILISLTVASGFLIGNTMFNIRNTIVGGQIVEASGGATVLVGKHEVSIASRTEKNVVIEISTILDLEITGFGRLVIVIASIATTTKLGRLPSYTLVTLSSGVVVVLTVCHDRWQRETKSSEPEFLIGTALCLGNSFCNISVTIAVEGIYETNREVIMPSLTSSTSPINKIKDCTIDNLKEVIRIYLSYCNAKTRLVSQGLRVYIGMELIRE